MQLLWVYTNISDGCFLLEWETSSDFIPGELCNQEKLLLLQSRVTAIVSAVRGTYIVFMAEAHSLEGLPGYALHQMLRHPVLKEHIFIWVIENIFAIAEKGKRRPLSDNIAQGPLSKTTGDQREKTLGARSR